MESEMIDVNNMEPKPGLYEKFTVVRNVGEDKPGEQFFVLSPTHDPMAREALRCYAAAARREGLTALASDIWDGIERVNRGGPFYQYGGGDGEA